MWAEMLADKRRLLFESGISGVLWGLGDFISQRIEGTEELDMPRMARMAGYGLVLAGPTCSVWYRWIDRASPNFVARAKLSAAGSPACLAAWRRGLAAWQLLRQPRATLADPRSAARSAAAAAEAHVRTASEALVKAAEAVKQCDKSKPGYKAAWSVIATKLFFDTAVFEPSNLVIFFMIQDMLEGKSVPQAWEHVCETFGPTFKYDVAVWSPVQIVNFRFIPAQSQGLVVNAVSVGWNAFLSLVQSQGFGQAPAPAAAKDDHVPLSKELHWNHPDHPSQKKAAPAPPPPPPKKPVPNVAHFDTRQKPTQSWGR